MRKNMATTIPNDQNMGILYPNNAKRRDILGNLSPMIAKFQKARKTRGAYYALHKPPFEGTIKV